MSEPKMWPTGERWAEEDRLDDLLAFRRRELLGDLDEKVDQLARHDRREFAGAKELLTLREADLLLGKRKGFTAALLKKGKITSTMIEGCRRISRAEVERYAQQGDDAQPRRAAAATRRVARSKHPRLSGVLPPASSPFRLLPRARKKSTQPSGTDHSASILRLRP
jgi:hypothetical protein